MPVSPDLLEILCCPKTKVPVVMLSAEKLARVNAEIESGRLVYADGSKVDKPLQEGLITEDNARVYRVDDDIPVMLVDQAIETKQIEGW